LYTFVENTSAYDFKVWYFWFLNLIFQEPFNAYLSTYWFWLLNFSEIQLFISVLLDQYFLSLLSKLPYNDNWFRMYLASIDTTSTLYYYPELLALNENNNGEFLFPILSYERSAIEYLLNSEHLLTAVMLFPQYVLTLMLITALFITYFQFFTSSVKEENLIDQDFLISLSLIEAEEEISSPDDMAGALLLFIYVFFWFFYIYVWTIIEIQPEFMLIFCLMPFIYVVIFLIPTNLLVDFGIYFVAYLRGSASTPNFLFEAMYDYIAIFALFIRLFVQGVRLLLMLFVYASLHDYILFWSWHSRFWLYGNYDIWRDLTSLELTFSSISYFVLKLPGYVIYWIYELLHTFFVVTGQFIAFFAMVFWLFFYLYTFFTYEPHEEYLSFMRKYKEIRKGFGMVQRP
jgi:hypothetical protein